MVHVAVVTHAALHHLHLLVPVVADGEWLRVTRTLAENVQLTIIFWGKPQRERGRSFFLELVLLISCKSF